MSLFIQFKMIFITFIYGLFFYFSFNVSKKVLIHSKKLMKIILNTLFMIDHALIYFILIKSINNSVLHIYLFIFFILLYTKEKTKLTIAKILCYTKNEEPYKKGGIIMKRKKVRKNILLLLIFYVTLGLILLQSLGSTTYQIIQKRIDKKKYSEELSDLKDKEEELKSTVTKLQDPDYVARYAREKYLYSKEGEIIIRIPE